MTKPSLIIVLTLILSTANAFASTCAGCGGGHGGTKPVETSFISLGIGSGGGAGGTRTPVNVALGNESDALGGVGGAGGTIMSADQMGHGGSGLFDRNVGGGGIGYLSAMNKADSEHFLDPKKDGMAIATNKQKDKAALLFCESTELKKMVAYSTTIAEFPTNTSVAGPVKGSDGVFSLQTLNVNDIGEINASEDGYEIYVLKQVVCKK